MWLDFRALKLEQKALIEVLENHDLYLSNGLDFGENCKGFMCMNIAATHEVIIKAMEQLKKAFVKEQIL